jgi:hypothetical protein
MVTMRRAAPMPFQSFDCHIANHSPPMVMKPPRNNATTISRPADANLRALSSLSRR